LLIGGIDTGIAIPWSIPIPIPIPDSIDTSIDTLGIVDHTGSNIVAFTTSYVFQLITTPLNIIQKAPNRDQLIEEAGVTTTQKNLPQFSKL